MPMTNHKEEYELSNLPTMPVVAAETIKLLKASTSSADQLASVVGRDPVVTARVLKVANSSYYSLSRKVTTLSTAIVVLGEQTLKSLVLAASVRGLHRGLGAYERMLWEDAMTCALASRFLATKLHLGDPEETFIAGLFRHIGKLVLCQQNSLENPLIPEMIKTENAISIERERRLFGIDHAGVGAAVLKYWQLSDSFVQVAQHHFDAEVSTLHDQKISDMVCLVNISSEFPAKLGIFGPHLDVDLAARPGALHLQLDSTTLDELHEEFAQILNQNRMELLH